YNIRITNDVDCISALFPFTIDDNSVTPTLTASQTAPSTVCPGGTNPDGDATVTITNDDAGTYTFAWYAGTAATGTVIATTQNLTNVAAGDYTVLVTDTDGTGTGCPATATTEIVVSQPTITINTADNTGASNCDNPNNGTYEVTDVFENGASVAAIGDYQYEFFNNGGTSIQGPSATASISSLTPGNYTVIIQRTASLCSSAALPFTIDDIS
ncbi:MAG: hypothetical protein JXR03_21615, partial [Cyclobacteriaceae bacterium]